MARNVEELVDKLFGAFEAGDYDAAGKLFAEQGTVSQCYGDGGPPKPWAEVRVGLQELVKAIGNPKYTERRKICTPTSFVEQHVTVFSPPGAKADIKIPCVLVGRLDPMSSLIVSLEEYLDPSPLGLPDKKKRSASGRPSRRSSVQPDLRNKVVVVSGASSGIGEGIALECAKHGAKLVLTARREGQLDRVANACTQAGASDVTTIPGDICKEDTVRRVVEAALRFGGVDRLYVNAGISQNAHFMEAPVDHVREQMEVNFFGGVLLTRGCLPLLLERSGRIVAITSLHGRLPAATKTGYSASKHAMHGFFESLRQEIEPQGVGVTMVLPGPVNTDIFSNLKGPAGKTVAFIFDEATRSGMTSASEAGRIAVTACEAGEREVAFPAKMATLMQLRAKDPEKVDAILQKMYEGLKTEVVTSPSKL